MSDSIPYIRLSESLYDMLVSQKCAYYIYNWAMYWCMVGHQKCTMLWMRVLMSMTLQAIGNAWNVEKNFIWIPSDTTLTNSFQDQDQRPSL